MTLTNDECQDYQCNLSAHEDVGEHYHRAGVESLLAARIGRADPRCQHGNSYRLHTGPCGPVCDYPGVIS